MKTHEFDIKLKFNKPVKRHIALFYAKEHIKGNCLINNQQTGIKATKMKIAGIKIKASTSADHLEDYLLNPSTIALSDGNIRLFKDNGSFILRYKGTHMIMDKKDMGRIAGMLSGSY